MGLRFDPVGGGQFKQAVKQIIEAESQPVKQLESRKTREQARLKLFQEFKGKFAGAQKALEEISTFSKFRELKSDMGEGNNWASVTIDKEKAQPGSFQIQIDELAARSSAISNGFDDPEDAALGIGFVVLKGADGKVTEVFIDEEKASLRGVADLINKQANSPVRAAVIQDAADGDSPWKLILTAKKDGAGNKVDFPEFYFLDGSKDFYVDDARDAKNAKVQIDGFPLELNSNDISDFLPGVNLHLKQAKPDQPFTLTITEDTQKISGKVKGFVDKMNEILGFIVKQNAVDESTDTRTTFAGDSGLQTIEYRFRNLLHEGFPIGDPDSDGFRFVFLNQLGVEFDKTGQLSFKEEKFNKLLEKDYDGISQAIAGEFGFAFQMKEVLSQYTRGGDGVLNLREQGLQGRIKEIDRQIEEKTKRLEQRQQSLVEQFSRLEASLGNLQRQQQYLSAALPGGGGGNIVSQLLGG